MQEQKVYVFHHHLNANKDIVLGVDKSPHVVKRFILPESDLLNEISNIPHLFSSCVMLLYCILWQRTQKTHQRCTCHPHNTLRIQIYSHTHRHCLMQSAEINSLHISPEDRQQVMMWEQQAVTTVFQRNQVEHQCYLYCQDQINT